jgi:UDP-2-acetamido-2,6-beta-L-arabino-hexul-4-ose reductase
VLDSTHSTPHVIYANTTHAEGPTPYGASKQQAAESLAAWADRAGGAFTDLLFPNLFGECGRPDYNSAVATFCRDLAEGRESVLNAEGSTELLHVQDACEVVLDAAATSEVGRRRIPGVLLSIPDLYSQLRRLRDGYAEAAVPALHDRFELRLFNALRTAMFPKHYPMPLTAHRDARGMFVELARGHGQGQTSFSVTRPGKTRGEHFHFDKIERFVVIRGTGVIKLRRLFDTEVFAFEVRGEDPAVIDMPPLYTHNIANVGDDEMLTMFWANDHFDPHLPDTYAEQVEPALAGTAR